MLVKLNNIIMFALIAFFISWILYPIYISILKKYKLGKTIRESAVTGEQSKIFSQMHEHKKWTPTMWGGIFLIVMGLMVGLSFMLKDYKFINNTLFNRQETYVLLFGFFSMGLIGLVDDFLNIKGHGAVNDSVQKLNSSVWLFFLHLSVDGFIVDWVSIISIFGQ